MKDLDDYVKMQQLRIIAEARRHYSETVVNHWIHPRNVGLITNPDGFAELKGICGDILHITLRIKKKMIGKACFVTDGCITSIAAGSMVVELATGKTLGDALAISANQILERLGGLPEESQHCAHLAADTLRAAIHDYFDRIREPWKQIYRRF